MNQYGFCDYPTYTINGDGSRGICSGCGYPTCTSERIEKPKPNRMKRLSLHNYTLIEQAVKVHGTFDPRVISYFFIEHLRVKDAVPIFNFLKWVHDNGKTFGHGNYQEVFAEFLQASK